eukprot:CAMPEP_0172620740 /NCGR_PEP_ID=MMETSP1068-20121228/105844_1 /TAXON_ID=35684 /ORGANISM="Pseudopedinella elastica, Strain CCMP716" /LENGTH=74 /DNA_ID=CAMNT_0013428125 /DNA_START=1 /DNA_END=225 /DNA_ORIENTATION=+
MTYVDDPTPTIVPDCINNDKFSPPRLVLDARGRTPKHGLYTRDEFLEYYGDAEGAARWEQAAAAERRRRSGYAA